MIRILSLLIVLSFFITVPLGAGTPLKIVNSDIKSLKTLEFGYISPIEIEDNYGDLWTQDNTVYKIDNTDSGGWFTGYGVNVLHLNFTIKDDKTLIIHSITFCCDENWAKEVFNDKYKSQDFEGIIIPVSITGTLKGKNEIHFDITSTDMKKLEGTNIIKHGYLDNKMYLYEVEIKKVD